MMKIVQAVLALFIAGFLSGCVSYSYSGKKEAAPTSHVVLYTDSAKIKVPYQVLGRAIVSGNYQHVSRDRMMEKLSSEARKAGADAVLIVEQQVLPAGMIHANRGQGFFTAFDYDDTNRSWGELYKDVDVTIGNIGKKSNTDDAPISDYKRIIRAEFLRFTDTPAPVEKK